MGLVILTQGYYTFSVTTDLHLIGGRKAGMPLFAQPIPEIAEVRGRTPTVHEEWEPEKIIIRC